MAVRKQFEPVVQHGAFHRQPVDKLEKPHLPQYLNLQAWRPTDVCLPLKQFVRLLAIQGLWE